MKLKNTFKAIISAAVGGISTFLGLIGGLSLCFCSFPVLAALLAALGISSLVLAEYNILFLLTGIIFISLSIFYLFRLVKQKGGRK